MWISFFLAPALILLSSCGDDSSSKGSHRSLDLPELGSAEEPWLKTEHFSSDGILTLAPEHLQYAVKPLDFRSFWSRFDARFPQLTVGTMPSECTTYDDIEALTKVTGKKGELTMTTEYPPAKCEVEDVSFNVSYRRYIHLSCEEFDFSTTTLKDLETGLPEFKDCASLGIRSDEEVHAAQLWNFGNGFYYYNVKEAKRSVGAEEDGPACAFKVTNHEVEQTGTCFIREMKEDLENQSTLAADIIPVGKYLKVIELKELKGKTNSNRSYYESGTAIARVNDWTAQIIYDSAASSTSFAYVFGKEGVDPITGDKECQKFPLCE